MLDDSTCKATCMLVDDKVVEWRERGVNIQCLRRNNRQGYKAGALKEVRRRLSASTRSTLRQLGRQNGVGIYFYYPSWPLARGMHLHRTRKIIATHGTAPHRAWSGLAACQVVAVDPGSAGHAAFEPVPEHLPTKTKSVATHDRTSCRACSCWLSKFTAIMDTRARPAHCSRVLANLLVARGMQTLPHLSDATSRA